MNRPRLCGPAFVRYANCTLGPAQIRNPGSPMSFNLFLASSIQACPPAGHRFPAPQLGLAVLLLAFAARLLMH
jgi:hypothetical protein